MLCSFEMTLKLHAPSGTNMSKIDALDLMIQLSWSMETACVIVNKNTKAVLEYDGELKLTLGLRYYARQAEEMSSNYFSSCTL